MAEEKEKQHPAKIQKRIEVFDLLEAKQIAPKEAARQLKRFCQNSVRMISDHPFFYRIKR